MIATIAFFLFSGIMIASAILTMFARNPVHSVLWLIVAFFNAAGLMLLMGAEFIAMLLVIVYVGAVAVLFLFVVMMLNIDFATLRGGVKRNLPLGILIALVLLAEMVVANFAWKAGPAIAAAARPNIETVGAELYSRFLLPFELAGLILLVAMIGAIVLTLRGRRDVRPQHVPSQIARRPEEAVVNRNPAVGEGVQL